MRYAKIREDITRAERKVLVSSLAAFAVPLAFYLIAKRYLLSTWWTIAVFLACLFVLWVFVKVSATPPATDCTDCGFDLVQTVILLGKKSDKGFCPCCGKEIA